MFEMGSSAAVSRKHMASIAFSITGAAVTDHVRLQVLSEDWRGAYDLLINDVGGCTHDIAIAILKGEKAFSGDSADRKNPIRLVDDGPENPKTKRYLDTLDYQNRGLLRFKGKSYRPAWKIDALGQDDFDFAVKKLGRSAVGTEEFTKARAHYYVASVEKDLLITAPKQPINAVRADLRSQKLDHWLMVWELRDHPSWITPKEDAAEALAHFIENRIPQSLGACTDVLDMKEDTIAYAAYLRAGIGLTDEEEDERNHLLEAEHLANLVTLREKITSQAGPKGEKGWIRLPVRRDKSWHLESAPDYYVDVPKLAFIHWALGQHDPVKLGICEAWDPVCTSGMKMINDDRYHSDWVVGAGFDPERFYQDHEDVSDSSYWLRQELCHELLDFEFTSLSRSTKKQVDGKVRHLKPGDALKEGEIGIIPVASVDYDAALRSAAQHGTALICEAGGPLAHIAIVGREMDVPVILWPKAMTLFNGSRVYINLERGKILLSAI